MKKLFSLLLCLILLTGVLPAAAPARAATQGDWTYRVTGGSATILKYNGAGGAVTIPSALGNRPVTSIGSDAFLDCVDMTSVTIPASVTKVGSYAFDGCTGLQWVDVGDLAAWCATEFGNPSANPLHYAHVLSLNGTAAADLSIPEGTESIGSFAFSGCTSLRSVTIPESVTEIGSGAFYGCIGLTRVTLPSGVTRINDRTFEGCAGLTGVTIPACTESIGDFAFYGCAGLTGMTIPSGVKLIGDCAFCNCSGLISVTISSGAVSIGKWAFSWCGNLTGVSLPESLESIGEAAFACCRSLTGLTVPANVSAVGEDAFFACDQIMSAGPIGSGSDLEFGWMDSIPANAFSGCKSLRTAVIPGTASAIRKNAFLDCGLEQVWYGGTAEQWNALPVSGGNDPLHTAVLYYGYQAGDPIILASGSCGGSLTWTLDHAGQLTISGTGTMNSSPFGFDYQTRLSIRSAVIGSGATSIGSYAFSNFYSLSRIMIPKSLTSIGGSAFANCASLTDVFYGSTSADWNAISIGKNNEPLTSADIHYPEPLTVTGITADKAGVRTGETVAWSASASGGYGPLQFCFYLYKDGSLIQKGSYGSANAFSYTPTEAGTYKVKVYVKDDSGSSASKTGNSVAVSEPVSIISVSADRASARTGEAVTWSVSASGGAGTLQYYFILYKDGTQIKTRAYGTDNTFSYTPTEAGTYKVKVYVKDDSGSSLSQTDDGVAVFEPVSIISVSADRASARTGEAVTWSVSASGGAGTLQYYFILYKDGTQIKTRAYGTDNTFSYTPTEAGTYKVKAYVKDDPGPSVSKIGDSVAVSEPVSIVSVSADKASASTGETVVWSVSASGGAGTLQYYFILYRDGTQIKTRAYGTDNTFSYTPTEAGTYKVKAYVKDNSSSSVNKTGGSIAVSVKAPTIMTQPAGMSVAEGKTAVFSVAASGSGLTYQWQYSSNGGAWKNKSGATSSSYTVTAKTSFDGVLYRCVVKNAGGSVTSNSAKLTVVSADSIIAAGVKADKTSASAGEKITWTATASGGTGTLQYYFILYKDGTRIKTRGYRTTASFSYTPSAAGTYQAKVYVKDAEGIKVKKLSSGVTVTVGPAAIISVKADKTGACVGEKITWTAAAVGSAQPLQYYFILYKNGTKVKTRVYSTTKTFNFTPTEPGVYRVRVFVKDADGVKVKKLSGSVTVTG